MANPREESVYMAKAAEQAERYEEMVEFMEQVTAAAAAEGDELTSEETLLLSAAYKNVISARRESWRVVSSVAQKEESRGNENRVAPVRGYRAKIESELSSICDGILRLLEAHLIPSTSDPELKIFFLKMKGDYHRYLAEFMMGTDREEAAESTLAAYTSAQDTAVAELSPAHPIRMSLALNLSVFYYQIQNSPAQAYKVAEQAFDDAIEDIDNLPEEHYEDCTSIMKIIRDNLTLWTSDLKENGTRGQSSNP